MFLEAMNGDGLNTEFIFQNYHKNYIKGLLFLEGTHIKSKLDIRVSFDQTS